MKVRIVIAALLATAFWFPQSAQTVSAIYCYPGDPPGGLPGLRGVQRRHRPAGPQPEPAEEHPGPDQQTRWPRSTRSTRMIASLKNQIAAQQALIASTQAAIDDLEPQDPLRRGRPRPAGSARHRPRSAVEPAAALHRLARQRELHAARADLEQHEPADEQAGRGAAGRGLGSAASRGPAAGAPPGEHRQLDLSEKKTEVSNLLQAATGDRGRPAEATWRPRRRRWRMSSSCRLSSPPSTHRCRPSEPRSTLRLPSWRRPTTPRRGRRAAARASSQWPIPACGYGCITPGFWMLELLSRGLRPELPLATQDPHGR